MNPSGNGGKLCRSTRKGEANSCRNAFKNGSTQRKLFKATNEQLALLCEDSWGAMDPVEIKLWGVPWYRMLWTGKVKSEGDDARLGWNCGVWKKGGGGGYQTWRKYESE